MIGVVGGSIIRAMHVMPGMTTALRLVIEFPPVTRRDVLLALITLEY